MEITSNWTGLTPYSSGLELQKSAFENVKNKSDKVHLLGMEHPEVLTLGLRSHNDPLIPIYEKQFKEVIKIRRGGHLVIHNPGQLVIYPVLSLKTNRLSIRDYICLLTKITQKVLKKIEVETFEKKEPGLFTQKGKIAMFGVGVNQGVTQHGICINMRNDLSAFTKIALCDVRGEAMDSLKTCQKDMELVPLFKLWCEQFKDMLNK